MTSFLLGLKKKIEICKSVKAWKISAVKKSTILNNHDIHTVCHIIYSGCFSSSACLYRSLFVFETSTCTHTYIIPLHHLPRFQYKHTHMQWITRPSEYFLCPPPPSRDTLCEDTVRPVMDRQWRRGEGERKGMQHHLASSSRVWMWGREGPLKSLGASLEHKYCRAVRFKNMDVYMCVWLEVFIHACKWACVFVQG